MSDHDRSPASSQKEIVKVDSPVKSFEVDRTAELTSQNVRPCWSSTTTAIWVCLVINITLLLLKIVALVDSGSMAILSSLVDSALDLVSQGILCFVEEKANKKPDPETYVVGRTRLEPVGIIFMAAVMAMAAVEILRDSIVELVTFASETPEQPDVSFLALFGMALAATLKFFLYLYTRKLRNPITNALAEDARNDVLTNLTALGAFGVAAESESLWFFDQVGAILLSIYIIFTWVDVGREQTRKLTGITASEDQIEEIRDVIAWHDRLQLDRLRAYHIGRCLMVEIEAVMPPETYLREVHDESLSLQQHVEKLKFVERCFVHVDYEHRDYDEHKLPKLLD